MSISLLIIGIGSPFGNDRVGWRVIDLLEDQIDPALPTQLIKLDRPNMALIEYLDCAPEVWLIDALLTNEPAGTLHELDPSELATLDSLPTSSHGLGVKNALDLAKTLNKLPEKLEIHAISTQRVDSNQTEMDTELERAATELAEVLHKRLHKRQGEQL